MATEKRCCVGDRRIPALIMDNPVRRLLAPSRRLVSKYISGGEVVADLGCGPGFHAMEMARIVGPSGKVYAVDFDDKAIRKLREKAEGMGYSNIETHVSSAADLGFILSSSVDFVLANGLLCCMVDHTGAVSGIKRILKPDGLAHLSITRTFLRRDQRAVDVEEWRGILAGFRVVEEGRGLLGRWADVLSYGASLPGGAGVEQQSVRA